MSRGRPAPIVYAIVLVVLTAGCTGGVDYQTPTAPSNQAATDPSTTGTSDSTQRTPLYDYRYPLALDAPPIARKLHSRARADGEISESERRIFEHLHAIDPTYRTAVGKAVLAGPGLNTEVAVQLRVFRKAEPTLKSRMLAVGLAGQYAHQLPPWVRVYVRAQLPRQPNESVRWEINSTAPYATLTSVNALEERLWADGELTRHEIEGLVIFSRYVHERSTFKNRTWSRYDQVRRVLDLRSAIADGDLDPRTVRRLNDTDGDLLINGWERDRSHTDPTTPHTDTDSFTDAEEVFALPAIVPPAEHPDPTRPDVYVEVDYETGLRPKLVGERTLKAEFDDHGVTLHVLYDDALTDYGAMTAAQAKAIAGDNADYDHKGFFYAILVDETTRLRTDRTTLLGVAYDDFFVAKYNIRAFAHELGHVLGLSASDYRGIDTDAQEDYQSVMKYGYGPLEYSDHPPFNDWKEMYETGFKTSTQELTLRCRTKRACR